MGAALQVTAAHFPPEHIMLTTTL